MVVLPVGGCYRLVGCAAVGRGGCLAWWRAGSCVTGVRLVCAACVRGCVVRACELFLLAGLVVCHTGPGVLPALCLRCVCGCGAVSGCSGVWWRGAAGCLVCCL